MSVYLAYIIQFVAGLSINASMSLPNCHATDAWYLFPWGWFTWFLVQHCEVSCSEDWPTVQASLCSFGVTFWHCICIVFYILYCIVLYCIVFSVALSLRIKIHI